MVLVEISMQHKKTWTITFIERWQAMVLPAGEGTSEAAPPNGAWRILF
jgi:hypothetical protein